MKLNKNKKAFTLIELIVVMAIIGILVLLAMPKFIGHTQKAKWQMILTDSRAIEDASERFAIKEEAFPIKNDVHTKAELEALGKIYTYRDKEVTLDSDGQYYDIDTNKLADYVKVKSPSDLFVIENKSGNVFIIKHNSSSIPVPEATEVLSVIAPYDWDSTLVLKSDGTVWRNGYDGNENKITSEQQIDVGGIKVVKLISYSGWSCGHHAYALLENGDVYGMGENNASQLGETIYNNNPLYGYNYETGLHYEKYNMIKIEELSDIKDINSTGYGVLGITESNNLIGTGRFYRDYSSLNGQVESIDIETHEGVSANIITKNGTTVSTDDFNNL